MFRPELLNPGAFYFFQNSNEMEEIPCTTKTTFHTRTISPRAASSNLTKTPKSAKRQTFKLVSMSQLKSDRIPSTSPKPPEPVTIHLSEPSRPHLTEQLDEDIEENDYASLLDKSRALKKFTSKSSGVFVVKDTEEIQSNYGKKYPRGFKGCLYKLHSVKKPSVFTALPKFKSIKVGEVKRTYGKAVKKNSPAMADEHVEVKIECDPQLLLDSMEENREVQLEDEAMTECNHFEFIDVKEEPEIIACE